MSRGADGDLFESLHEGWTNRETYAAHLHLTADEGLVYTAAESLKLVAVVQGTVDAESAGRVLAGLLDRHLEELDDARLEEEYRAIKEDVGSFWRVNWTEVGAAFLDNEEVAA